MATTNKFFKVKNGLDVNSNATVDASGNANIAGNLTANAGFVSADTFRLDTTYAGGSTQPGEISWDPDNETAMIALDAGETLQIGQEHVIRVKNSSASVAIPKGRVVMFAGAAGDTVTVTPAISTQAYEPYNLVGVTAEEIAADGFGFVTQYGFINQVSTGSFTLGDLLYVDPASPGVLTNSTPSAPNWTFPVAAVTRVHASAGRILVRAIPGGHLHDVVDVAISSPANNQVLTYSSGIWINANATGGGGNSFETISANGTSVVADSSTDTLTITPGDGLSIAGNAASDTITFTPNVAGASANGIVTTGTQTFGGEKTFASNVAGTNGSFSGNVNATTFYGSGSGLTSIPSIVTDDTKPSSPVDGQVWFNASTGKTYVYYVDADTSQWVEVFGAKDLQFVKDSITEIQKTPGTVNYLINGGFDFWQRGTSFSADGYCADRWYFDETGVCTVSQYLPSDTEGLPPGFNYGIRALAATSSDSADLYQPLESSVVIPLRGKTVTFSCYLKMDANMRSQSGDFELIADYSSVSDARTSQTTAIGTAVLDKSLYSNWARASYTFTVPADAVGLMVGIEPPLSDSSQPQYFMTGAMLELGTFATNFRRSGSTYTEEQNACFRYYQRHITIVGRTDNTNVWKIIGNPIGELLRATPTSVIVGTISTPAAGGNIGTNITLTLSGRDMYYTSTGSSSNGAWLNFDDVKVECEL